MRANNGIDLRTGAAFLRNEFYNMSIYRVSFWLNLIYTFLMMYSVGYVWRALYAANPSVTGVPLPQMISYAVLGGTGSNPASAKWPTKVYHGAST